MTLIATPADDLFAKHHTVTADGHWIWSGPMNGNYPQMAWRADRKKVRRPARVWAWERAHGPLQPGQLVAPTCGEPLCVAPAHAHLTNNSAVHTAPDEMRASRFWARVDRSSADGCWPWRGVVAPTSGYGRTTWGGRGYGAHQVAHLLANGWVPSGRTMYVCHHCDNPLCCRPDHLYAGTPTDNAQDRVRRDRSRPRRGAASPGAKLTAEQVAELRARYAAGGTSYPKLAAEYGLHPQNIGRIVRGEGY